MIQLLFILLFVCLIASTFIYAATAEFEHYEMTDENDFRVEVIHKKYMGSEDNRGAARYSVETWYMFSKSDYDAFWLNDISSYNKSVFRNGAEITLNTVSETPVDSYGFFTQIKQMDAEKLMVQVRKLHTREQLLSDEGITVYFSPVLRCKQWDMDGKLIQNQLVYGYEDFMKFVRGGQWSEGTQRSVAAMFNTEVHLSFHKAAFTVKFAEVDERGSILNDDLEGFSYSEAAEKYGGKVLYGEKLSFSKSYTGIKEGYVYQGHAWGNPVRLNQSSVPSDITITRSNASEDELVLYFCFQKKQVPLPPTQKPTSLPDDTHPPFPTLGASATPLPTATPAPTLLPTEDRQQQDTYMYYFTTDAGYTMETVSDSTSYYIATENASNSYVVSSCAFTLRDMSYKVGTDKEGNKWYFIPDKMDAAYVHPAVYQGFRCNTSEVRYIRELVFPSVIMYNGTDYIVRSIGGGTAKYKSEYENSEESWNNTTGYGYQKEYSYGISKGSYGYYRYVGSGTAYTKNIDSSVSYSYGVLGNGSIISSGSQSTDYSTGAVYRRNYGRSYYFYNTTLEVVTIPDTVTSILPGAFEYCQALNAIHGADNVKLIGNAAFCAADSGVSRVSSTWTEQGVKNYDYYYYNLSYSTIEGKRTDAMSNWELRSKLCSYLHLPEFQNLTTIDSVAFCNRTNLYDVVFADKVAFIGNNAFGGCKLHSFELMGSPVIQGKESTLGTNGSGDDRTLLITTPDSSIMEYGKRYRRYYRLKCGYPVTYEPNGGEGSAFCIMSDLVFRPAEFVDSFSIEDSNGKEKCYVTDKQGNIWYINNAQNRMEKLSYRGGEIIYQDGKNVLLKQDALHYLKLSYGTFLDAYEIKVQGELKKIISVGRKDMLYLTSDNKLYGCSVNTGMQVCLSKQPVLGVGLYNNKEVYILADGTTWTWNGNSFWQADPISDQRLPNKLSIRFIWNNTYGAAERQTRYVDSEGMLWTYQYHSETRKYSWSTENFGKGFCFPSGIIAAFCLYADYRYELTLLECETGEVYLVKLPQDDRNRSSYAPHIEKVITAFGGLQRAEYLHLSAASTAYNGVLYLIDKEGYMWTAVIEYATGCSFPEKEAEGKRIKKYAFLTEGSRSSAMLLDEEGCLWSAGYNAYGQTGNQNTYQRPLGEISQETFVKVSSGTFVDFRMEARSSVALGTDGSLYGAGYGHELGNDKGNYTSFTRLDKYKNIKKIGNAAGYVLTEEGSILLQNSMHYLADNGYDYFTTIAGSGKITKEGHRFTGWNTRADGTGTSYVPGEEFVLHAPLTLYATWEASKNRIIYHANGGNGYMPASELESSVKRFALPASAFSKKGFAFMGWAMSEQGAVVYKDKEVVLVPEGTTVFYAKWHPVSYSLKFANEAFGLHTGYHLEYHMSYGSSVQIPDEPFSKAYTVSYHMNRKGSMSTEPSMRTVLADVHTKASFVFMGWKLYRKQEDGFHYLSKKYPSGTVAANLTSIEGDMLVMFPEWGGTASYVTLPVVSCDGYEFCGWSLSAEETESSKIIPVDTAGEGVSVYQPTGNQMLYAHYAPKEYRVLLDGQGAELQEQSFIDMKFDQKSQDLQIPKKSRFVFMGYYTKPNGEGDCYFDKDGRGVKKWQVYDGSVEILYAYWVPEKAIIYHANGGEGNMQDTWIDFDKMGAYLNLNQFCKTGYYFDKKRTWNTEADGSGQYYADGQYADNITKRLTLYSQWLPIEYRIYYANDSFGKQTAFTAENWKYDENYFVKGQPFAKYNVVSYDLNRGSKSTLPSMATVLTELHTKGVYPFMAYDLYSKKGTAYTNLEIQYTEGQPVYNLTVVHGAEFALFPRWEKLPLAVILPSAECRGYRFEGWTLSKTGEDIENIWKESYVAEKNTILYALWTPEQYTVVLNGRGATEQPQTSIEQIFDQIGESLEVPKKTGYTFHGYFTGTYGTGTKYYDADGTCIKAWAETSCKELYAYWIQDEVTFPDEEDKVLPTPLPEEERKGSLGRTDGTVLLYADDYDAATGALTDMQPYLAYDVSADGSIYNIADESEILSKGAIPSTEQICIRGRMGAWTFSYHLKRCSGIDDATVFVTVPYRTQYEGEEEELVVSRQKTATYAVKVPKAWSYWEIKESGLYYPEELWVENGALEEKRIRIPITAGGQEVQPPEYIVKMYGGKEQHIRWDSYHTDGTPKLEIVLEEEYIVSDIVGKEPEVEEYLRTVCENAAWRDSRTCEARSDLLVLLGETILADDYLPNGNGADAVTDRLSSEETEIPFTAYEQAYRSGIPLSETAENKEYQTFAWVVYRGSEKNIGVKPKHSITVAKVNAVHVHTPILCKGILRTEYTELQGEEELPVLVLKEEANFFEFAISNFGVHKQSLGYGMQDFRYALSGKANVAKEDGVLLNQVKFPFDVFLDTGNNSHKKAEDSLQLCVDGDLFVKAGNWITIGESSQKFYIPVSQKEGIFTIEARTVAVNCPKQAMEQNNIFTEKEDIWERNANKSQEAYIAYDKIDVKVQGLAYGLEILSIESPKKEERTKQNPSVILKKGSPMAFRLRTNGSFATDALDNAYIRIVPTYTWISEDKTIRKPIKLYYTEAVEGKMEHYIEIGSKKDLENIHFVKNTDAKLGISEELLRRTAALLKKKELYGECDGMFCFSKLQLGGSFRMLPKRENIFLPFEIERLEFAVQEWYGMFYLPTRIYAVLSDLQWNGQEFDLKSYSSCALLTGREEFFLKDGYIAVGFQIEAVNCFGDAIAYEGWENSDIRKAWEKEGLPYQEGDVVCYYLNKSIGDDYEVGGVE